MSNASTDRSDLIYGRRPVLEALKARKRPLHKIWLAENTHGTEDILKLARECGVPVERTSRPNLDSRAGGGHHQGIIAQASAVGYVELDDFLKRLGTVPSLDETKLGTVPRCVVVVLDEIQDPHNIGAILRTAAFFGAAAAILPRWRGGPVSETTVRVSSGGVEHIPLIREKNLAETVLTLQNAGFEVVGADMAGEPLQSYKVGRRTALVMGSEGDGIRRLVKERCDKLLSIRGKGAVASLNVSAAAAVFLNHFFTR